jgi:hypothetical protein
MDEACQGIVLPSPPKRGVPVARVGSDRPKQDVREVILDGDCRTDLCYLEIRASSYEQRALFQNRFSPARKSWTVQARCPCADAGPQAPCGPRVNSAELSALGPEQSVKLGIGGLGRSCRFLRTVTVRARLCGRSDRQIAVSSGTFSRMRAGFTRRMVCRGAVGCALFSCKAPPARRCSGRRRCFDSRLRDFHPPGPSPLEPVRPDQWRNRNSLELISTQPRSSTACRKSFAEVRCLAAAASSVGLGSRLKATK